jgi:uncharacterized protein (DUF1800 family)
LDQATLSGFFAGLLLASMSVLSPYLYAGNTAPASQKKKTDQKVQLGKAFRGTLPITELTEDEATMHALNRLAFGPRPGDLQRVKQMGLEKWVQQQLHPEKVDDRALDERLRQYPAVSMSAEALYAKYPPPGQQAKKLALTQEQLKQQQANQGEMKNRPQEIVLELSEAKITRAVYSERQLQEVMADFWFNHFNVFAGKGADRWMLPSYERDTIRSHTLGKFHDLLYATAKSPAMLFYLDNWLSVDPKAFEQQSAALQARRQRFQRIFGGDPNSIMVVRPNPNRPGFPTPQNGRPPGQGQAQNLPQRRGLNENYGRELMELHTLGVDGGYTQQDVTQAALALTGWTMRAPRRDPEFEFENKFHGGDPKIVLGKTIHAGGIKDGEELLDMLAQHPSTATFISTKLARRFVSDTPPPALVERMAATFQRTNGDIREMMKTMIYSPEFWSRAAYRAKIKSPFELVVSALRVTGADLAEALPAVRWTAQIGEPLYGCQPPTGYKDTADAWVNSGALLNRMNFSILLATGRMRDTKVDPAGLLGSSDQKNPNGVLDSAIQVFLGGQVSKETRAVLEKQLDDPQVLQAMFDDPVKNVDAGMIAGLVLGSPEFQRR